MAGYLEAAGAACNGTASSQYHYGYPTMGVVGPHTHPHADQHHGLASSFGLATHGHPHSHPFDHALASFPQGETKSLKNMNIHFGAPDRLSQEIQIFFDFSLKK